MKKRLLITLANLLIVCQFCIFSCVEPAVLCTFNLHDKNLSANITVPDNLPAQSKAAELQNLPAGRQVFIEIQLIIAT